MLGASDGCSQIMRIKFGTPTTWGELHTVTKHFKVARCDALGNLLDTTVFRQARLVALARARAFWNENDKTSADRYEQENDSDQ